MASLVKVKIEVEAEVVIPNVNEVVVRIKVDPEAEVMISHSSNKSKNMPPKVLKRGRKEISSSDPESKKITKRASPITLASSVSELATSSESTQTAFRCLKDIICTTKWELVEANENQHGTLQLELVTKEEVSDWLLSQTEPTNLPDLLLCVKGVVYFSTSTQDRKDEQTALQTAAKEDSTLVYWSSPSENSSGNYSTVGEAETRAKTTGGCVTRFVSSNIVEMRTEAGSPYPHQYCGIANWGAVGTLRLEVVQSDDKKKGGGGVYPLLKGVLSYPFNPNARTYLFTGFHPDDQSSRLNRTLYKKEDYLSVMREKQEIQNEKRRQRRQRWERLMPTSMVLEQGGSGDDELEFRGSDEQYVDEFKPPWIDDDDEINETTNADEMDETDQKDEMDWSGRPGHRCTICNRRSEYVGDRRGFNYLDNYCGGCVS